MSLTLNDLNDRLKQVDEETKFCPKCKKDHSTLDFYRNKNRYDGLDSECKQCRNIRVAKYATSEKGKEVHKKAIAKWRQANKDHVHSYAVDRRKNNKQRAVDLLGGKCSSCGKEYPLYVYDFHHINPEDKEYDPTIIFTFSWDKIEKEISKCILLCANCHRIEHKGVSHGNYL